MLKSMVLPGMQLCLSMEVDWLLLRLGALVLDAPALWEAAREQDLAECHRLPFLHPSSIASAVVP